MPGILRRCRQGARLATTHGSATWPDALRPVHRHNEGAHELPIGWRSSAIAVALRRRAAVGRRRSNTAEPEPRVPGPFRRTRLSSACELRRALLGVAPY